MSKFFEGVLFGVAILVLLSLALMALDRELEKFHIEAVEHGAGEWIVEDGKRAFKWNDEINKQGEEE